MTRTTVIRNERGMALPVALFALVVIGALVAGIFFTARIEIRSGENAMGGARAFEAAQAGLQMGVPQVVNLAGALSVGQTAVVPRTQLGTTGSYYEDSVTKLNHYVYLLRSYGTYEVNNNITSTRVLAMLVKRYMPELEVNSGAIVSGAATIKGATTLLGNDSIPEGWTGCSSGPDQPAIRSDGSVSVTGGGTTVTPAASSNDTTVGNMSRVLDTLFFQLASQANLVFTTDPGSVEPSDTTISGVNRCNTNDPTNWGDIEHDAGHLCRDYFPVIYLNAGGPGNDIALHGNQGQGILLVNGDLQMNGNMEFNGLILVRGIYETGGGTMTLTGSMITQNVDLDPNKWTGGLTVQYSSCAVDKALTNLAVSAPTSYRSFIQF